jgi:uncharacterized protein YukE
MVRGTAIIIVGVLLVFGLGGPALSDGGGDLGRESYSSSLFTDVPADHWALGDLQYLAERGIITGLPNGEFKGDQPLTRYAAVAMVARAVRFVLDNPDLITGQDLKVVQDLIYKINDKIQEMDGELSKLRTTGGGASSVAVAQLQSRVQQNTQSIQNLQGQLSSTRTSSADYTRLREQANASFIIALASLFVGIIGIALATM